MPKAKWHVGVKRTSQYPKSEPIHCDIFKSATEVTGKTHQDKYAYCWGAYTTRAYAVHVAQTHNYHIDNPKIERKGKLWYILVKHSGIMTGGEALHCKLIASSTKPNEATHPGYKYIWTGFEKKQRALDTIKFYNLILDNPKAGKHGR